MTQAEFQSIETGDWLISPSGRRRVITKIVSRTGQVSIQVPQFEFHGLHYVGGVTIFEQPSKLRGCRVEKPTVSDLKKQLEVGQAEALIKGEANAQRLFGRTRI